MEEVLRLGIDSTGAAQGARQFERATTSVQQSATKADSATARMEGSFNKLHRQVLLAERALGALGVTIGSGALVRSIASATAEMDRMQRGLVAIMGSASAAAREMEALRKIALAPGIDLKAAVQGATQLQAVGIGLQTTNRALTEFANAVALSGKGAPELERVFLQLQQLSSKGKVLQQDLRPILEAAPAVAQALKAAFGTVNAEDIANLGLTSDQFLTKLLDAMQKLPRATGGVANSWDNLKSAVWQASAAFGSNFVPAASAAMDALADSLISLSRNRKALADLALAAAALGKGAAVGGLAALTVGLGKMTVGLYQSAAGALASIQAQRQLAVQTAFSAKASAAAVMQVAAAKEAEAAATLASTQATRAAIVVSREAALAELARANAVLNSASARVPLSSLAPLGGAAVEREMLRRTAATEGASRALRELGIVGAQQERVDAALTAQSGALTAATNARTAAAERLALAEAEQTAAMRAATSGAVAAAGATSLLGKAWKLLLGPWGIALTVGATVATMLYNHRKAATDAASGLDAYSASLGKLNRAQLLVEQAELAKRTSAVQYRMANIQASTTTTTVDDYGRRISLTTDNPEYARLKTALGDLQSQSDAVKTALAGIFTPPTTPTAPPLPDEDTITKALEAALGRFAVKYGFLMPRLAENADIIAARGGLGRAGLLGIPNAGQASAPAGPALDVPTRFDSLRASAAKFGGGIKDQIAGLAAQFGPLALAAAALKPAFDGLRAVLEPVLSKLARPLEVMGRILGDVVTPVLELLQDPLEAVATLFSLIAQPLKLAAEIIKAYVAPGLNLMGKVLKVITGGLSYVVEGIGYVIKGIGQVVDKLVPDFISHAGKGLAKTGQDIIDGAERARRGFDAVATASDKLAASISTDLPKAINLALYRARIGAPGGGPVAGGPVGGGGGIGSGYHPPVYTPGNHPQPAGAGVVMNFAPGSVVNAAGDDHVTIARKFAKGAQVLHSQGEKLYAPGLVTAA